MLKVILAVVAIALVVWVVVRVLERRRLGGTSQPRVIAPDDDPDFLRGLDRRHPEDD